MEFAVANAIQTNNLSFSIGNKQILRNAVLNVEKHRFVGLIGPNGSGKTTLLKHLYRALPSERKVVFINGKDIWDYSYRESAREVTVMKQENSTEFEYKNIEMVLLGRAPYRSNFEAFTAMDRQIAMKSLECVGMSEYADRSYSTLSGGEKQRILIARSLTQEADILVLDEPTNHLDIHYQWAIVEIINGLNKTVLAVFHELNLACAYCDYIYVLKDGGIAAEGKPREIITRELLAAVFRIDAQITTNAKGKMCIIYNSALTP